MDWVSQMFMKSFGSHRSQDNQFKVDGSTFSFKNMKYSSERYNIIGFYYHSSNRDEAFRQMIFTFPTMFSQITIKRSGLYPVNNTFCCFVYDENNEIMVCEGTFTKRGGYSSRIEISISISSTMPSCFASLATYINRSLESNNIYTNFAEEAIECADFSIEKGGIQELYNFIFRNMRKKERGTKKPSKEHLESVRKRSEKILRDLSNFGKPIIEKPSLKQEGELTIENLEDLE